MTPFDGLARAAIDAAVRALSPVIITTWIPIERNSATAATPPAANSAQGPRHDR